MFWKEINFSLRGVRVRVSGYAGYSSFCLKDSRRIITLVGSEMNFAMSSNGIANLSRKIEGLNTNDPGKYVPPGETRWANF